MRAPAFWSAPDPTLAASLLAPLGALYGAVAAQRMGRRGLWRASIEVAAHEHVYQMGLQHRRCGTDGQGDRRCWMPLLASTAYIFQNEEGAKTWPVTEGLADEVRRAWACV